jgi:hypothetical protein
MKQRKIWGLHILESKKADFIYEGLMKPAMVPAIQVQQ